MPDKTRTFDFDSFHAELGDAEAALQGFVQDCRRIPEEMDGAFGRIAKRIGEALSKTAIDGEDAFRQLSKSILEEFARLALERVLPRPRTPEGCPPDPCGRGPVLTGGPVSVHFHMSGASDANAITRHQSQIAAAVARAVAYGRRNL